jgi:hypothetical protein
VGPGPNGQDNSTRKKLIEAGFIIAQGRGDKSLADDSEVFNLPAEYLARHTPQDLEVHFECWPAVELFRLCSTQWRVGPNGTRTGLDYTAVLAVADNQGKNDPDIIGFIQYLELGALNAFMDNDLETILDG